MRRPPVTLSSREQSAILRRLEFHDRLLNRVAKLAENDPEEARRLSMSKAVAAERLFTARLIKRFSA